jgi:hypothetical protein
MVWDWTVRLVLMALVVLIAVIIYWIVNSSRSMTGLERLGVALLAVAMLGIAGWWIASWFPMGEVPQQATEPRPVRQEKGNR